MNEMSAKDASIEVAKRFNIRIAYWAGQGFSGAKLYSALASDAELPAFFNSEDLAAILGISPLAIKKQRTRRTGPSFHRLSAKAVRYPRDELCKFLSSKFVRVAE